MSYEKFNSGWLVVTSDIEVDFDLETTPLEIMTDSALGSDEELNVNFLSELGEVAGGISILLETAPKYRLHGCMEWAVPFSATFSPDTIRIWRITLTRSSTEIRVTIHCNDEEVLNVLLSDNACHRMMNVWKTNWGDEVAKIKFPSSSSATDYYRAFKPVAPPGTYILRDQLPIVNNINVVM